MSKTLSGNLSTFSLADLLQWLEINALSGRVTLRRGDLVRTIDLKEGAIVFVSSTRPSERLGVFLAKRLVLPEATIYELLAESFATGRNLTRLILDRQLLSREKLAEAVEALAIEILLDLFRWTNAVFEFDPSNRPEDLIRIHLSLRGQVLAFHGVKSLDETTKSISDSSAAHEAGALWEREFRPEVLNASYWAMIDSLPGETPAVSTLRDGYAAFTHFAEKVHDRLREPARLYPIYDDAAALVRAALADGGDPERLVSIAALDPFFTVDLLYLANALRPDRVSVTTSARDAAAAAGPEAVRRLAGLLSDTGTPKVPAAERMEGLVRRSSLATAVAASHVSATMEFTPDEAYTLGIVETLGSYDLLKLLLGVPFPSGPMRVLALTKFRSVFGRVLARKLNLPKTHEDILGSSGRVALRSSRAEKLIFFAKQMIQTDQIGPDWMSDDPALAERFAALSLDPALPQVIARDAERLREAFQA
ncbi:MAG: DUF4388 domain-containing protein [Acidithiobacillales bacterium]